MSTSALDISRFNLEAFKTVVELRIAVAKAVADYNFRMAEVIEKQVKIAKDVERLNELRDALKDFKQARQAAQGNEVTLSKSVQRWKTQTLRASWLALGESLVADDVARAWNGYQFLLRMVPVPVKLSLNKIRANKEHRKGTHFSRNRFPNSQCSDAPVNVKTAPDLMNWARKKTYVPRNASPPQELLGQVFAVFDSFAGSRIQMLETELDQAKKDALRIRKLGWKAVQVEKEEPKKVPADDAK